MRARLIGALNRLRHQRIPSLVLRAIASPAVRLSDSLSTQARRKVKINGGSVNVEGIPIRFPANVGTVHLSSLYWRKGSPESEDIWWVLRALLPSAVRFADVGSYIGFYAVLAKKLNPGCDVWAFEPVPSIADKNRCFSAANAAPIRLWEVALSDRDGEASLYLPDSDTGVEESTATIEAHSWQEGRAEQGEASQLMVSTRRLDSLCQEHHWWPDLMKIDVEDHEAAALRGMEKVLRTKRPYVICEILPRDHGNEATLSMLRDVGYDLHAITPNGLFRVTELPRSRTYMDCLLAPASEIPEQLTPSDIGGWARSRAKVARDQPGSDRPIGT